MTKIISWNSKVLQLVSLVNIKCHCQHILKLNSGCFLEGRSFEDPKLPPISSMGYVETESENDQDYLLELEGIAVGIPRQ
jgi:hypothetical protein